jgi:CheY-like chemotaxis protein
MPVMDGFESVRRYRTFEYDNLEADEQPLFIVGMSVNTDNETIKEALAAGMDTFITKPFSYEKLTDVLLRSELDGCGRSFRHAIPLPPPCPPTGINSTVSSHEL